jgi:hypothetical protein
MGADFERYRKELGDEKVTAFMALCFHLADKVEKPYAALQNAANMSSFGHAQKIVYRVLDLLNGNFDSEAVGNALVEAFESPGVIPGLVEVRGGTGKWFIESRNIYQERGEPFTLDNLIPFCSFGIVNDPEHFFWDVRNRYLIDVPDGDPDDEQTREVTIMFNCFHVTQKGFEFAQFLFPDRMEEMRKREEAGAS